MNVRAVYIKIFGYIFINYLLWEWLFGGTTWDCIFLSIVVLSIGYRVWTQTSAEILEAYDMDRKRS